MSSFDGKLVSQTYKQILKMAISANEGVSASLINVQTGRTTQYAIKRNLNNPTLFLYPTPNNSTNILNIEAIRQVEDVNKSAGQNADAPVRFLPCLTAGLAYYLSMKRAGVAETRINMLKTNYEEILKRAMEEDKERASIYFKPKLRSV